MPGALFESIREGYYHCRSGNIVCCYRVCACVVVVGGGEGRRGAESRGGKGGGENEKKRGGLAVVGGGFTSARSASDILFLSSLSPVRFLVAGLFRWMMRG